MGATRKRVVCQRHKMACSKFARGYGKTDVIGIAENQLTMTQMRSAQI